MAGQDNLHDRYMAADKAHRAHRETCTECSPTVRCEAGRRLYERFATLQDAYLNRLRKS